MAEKPAAAEVQGEEIDSLELPAPAGWKKFIPMTGETPKRNGVLFISPTGEEIRNRRQLAQFLRSHPGGPSLSEFDWRFGDSPRRSVRLREKAKAKESIEEGPSKKRERKSSSNNGTKLKKSDKDVEKEEDEQVPESEKTATQEAESIEDAEMEIVEDISLKEKAESAIKTVEEGEINVKVSDQPSAETQEGKNENETETENMQLEDSNKDVPVVFAPESAGEENLASSKKEVKPEVEDNSAVVESHEMLAEVEKDAPVLTEHEVTMEDNSAVSENEGKCLAKGSTNDVPEGKNAESLAIRESPVDSGVSSHKLGSINEELREKEMKDRAFLNDGFKWGKKKVPSS